MQKAPFWGFLLFWHSCAKRVRKIIGMSIVAHSPSPQKPDTKTKKGGAHPLLLVRRELERQFWDEASSHQSGRQFQE
ncbi:MAG: hypothetical protein H9993_08590, partial [Candidatus Desulfovibrio faecigallinarum]|nr:hypothetical protein [Candidatus Desulfovibrio faecigallinarum]